MRFFEVFPVQIEKEAREILEGAEVEGVNKVLHGGFIRVRINCSRIISAAVLREAEEAVRMQLLKGAVNVRIENTSEYEYASVPEITVLQEEKTPDKAASHKAETVSSPAGSGNGNQKGRFKAKKKGPDEGMLYGRQFSGPQLPIAEILGDMKSVIFCGTLFENEVTVTKNGFKIFRFSVTDQTDSISVKLFIKEILFCSKFFILA